MSWITYRIQGMFSGRGWLPVMACLGIITGIVGGDPAIAGMSFVKKTTLVTPDGTESVIIQKVFVEGTKVRTEEDARTVEGNPGIHIYDFEKKKAYTVLRDVNFYIEDPLLTPQETLLQEPDPQTFKKYTESKEIRIEKVRHEDTVFQDHPVSRYKVKITQVPGKEGGEEKVLEHYSQWIREDLSGMPVRYEFEFPSKAKKIVEYLDITRGDLDPNLFKIPDAYIRIQPF